MALAGLSYRVPIRHHCEETFDAPTLFVGDAIIAVLIFAAPARRDHWLATLIRVTSCRLSVS